MLTKKEIKDIQNLRLTAARKEQRLFVVEGPKMVGELLELVPDRFQAVYATKDWQPSSSRNPNVIAISEGELSRISQLSTPNQVLAVVQQAQAIVPPSSGFVLYLDTIQDPGNMGTIIRTADWFGVKHIVCSKGCADVYSSKVVQSTMSSIVRVNVFVDEDDSWLASQLRPIYAAALNGKPIASVASKGDAVLIIGNESKGIREAFLSVATNKITIPRIGEAESLNAAVATGILLSNLAPKA